MSLKNTTPKKRKVADATNLSLEAKEAKEKVQTLNQNLMTEGEEIVKKVLPAKIAELTRLLENPILNKPVIDILPNLDCLEKLKTETLCNGALKNDAECKGPGETPGNEEASSSNPEAAEKRPESQGSVVKKKKKTASVTSLETPPHDSDSSDDEGTGNLGVTVSCNQKLIETMDTLKLEIKSAVEMVAIVKIWIQLMIPRIEDGNNFGVGVQEECLGELGRVEDQGFGALDSMNKYFQTRAKLVTKVLRHPNIMDYRQAVMECDEMEYVNLKIGALDLRNNYIIMYDLLHKNLEKITKPRSNAGQNMMML